MIYIVFPSSNTVKYWLVFKAHSTTNYQLLQLRWCHVAKPHCIISTAYKSVISGLINMVLHLFWNFTWYHFSFPWFSTYLTYWVLFYFSYVWCCSDTVLIVAFFYWWMTTHNFTYYISIVSVGTLGMMLKTSCWLLDFWPRYKIVYDSSKISEP